MSIDKESKPEWERRGTPKQIAYWNRMKNRRGKETPRWKGDDVGKSMIHKWLDSEFGKPKACENPYCKGRSQTYDWCLKTGLKYERKRDNFLRLCRSCHRKYDLTDEKRQQAIKNLWWATGTPHPNIYGKNGTKREMDR